jgi:uncharacterized protein (TIGR03435 family)
MSQLLGTIVCLPMILSCRAIAQTDADPHFEVASIKPGAPDARGMFIGPGPGSGISVTNATLKQLIGIAWRVQAFQISGGPAWLDSVHYDVVAKPETKPKQGEILLMLQSLLEDRFKLTFRRETKEVPIYALVMARKDGKLGPHLTESKQGGCTLLDPSKPPPEPDKPPLPTCGQMTINSTRMTAVSLPVANLVIMLSRRLGRTVADKTGLTGNFDMSLEWAADETQAMRMPPDAPAPPSSDAAGPSIFTALQEQLGLRLESQKGSIEILVIERAEKPSDN